MNSKPKTMLHALSQRQTSGKSFKRLTKAFNARKELEDKEREFEIAEARNPDYRVWLLNPELSRLDWEMVNFRTASRIAYSGLKHRYEKHIVNLAATHHKKYLPPIPEEQFFPL